jgi:predicted outer membrane repeat protein
MKHDSFIAIGLALCLCMGSFAVLPSTSSSAFTVTYVDDDAGYVDGDGDEYFSSIGSAINNTSAGGTVYVAEGTYPLLNYSLTKNIRLVGENPATTILDNDGMNRFLHISGVDASTLIEGFTLKNGGSVSEGGAIYVTNASPSISSCIFYNNTAEDSGSGYGGSIYTHTSLSTISDCMFDMNEATTTGGALYCRDSDLDIHACTFLGNEAAYSGAVHSGEGGSADVDYCLFKGNVAEPNNGESSVAGALRFDENTDSSVTNCRFFENSAEVRGGAIYISNSQGTVIANSVFNGNSASRGGAIRIRDSSSAFDSSTVITNCTFHHNSASTTASIIYASPSSGEFIVATMTNCIVWNNSTPIINSSGDGTFISNVTYSDVQGDFAGVGNIDTDPLFVEPPGDLSLQATSPCVDAGTDASAAEYGSVISDINGVTRPQGSGYDMGAYELYVATDDPWSPVSIMPLMRTQLASVGDAWNELAESLPEEPDEDMTHLIECIQGHMQNASGLTNSVYASGELARALELMNELSTMLES